MLSSENIDLSKFNEWKCDVKKNIYQFEQICQLIEMGEEEKDGGIVLEPDYQREYKFGVKKESSIIESLLLNIPIPVIYLSQNLNEEKVLLNVIDGAHRLRAMYRFFKDEYALSKLTILKDLEGKKFSNLPTNIKNRLKRNTQINVECIDITNNLNLEYEVFTRFNQATNPLKKQELNEVIYRSEFSKWVRNDLMNNLVKKDRFKKIFKFTEKRRKDKTLNYDLYLCLGYAYSGLIEGKNDTPFYVEKFMKDMMALSDEKLEKKKIETEEFINGFVEFYSKISNVEGIEYICSKEFINRKKPQGNHTFLTSFLVILTLTYDYLKFKGILSVGLKEDDYHKIYTTIVEGMKLADFGNFSNESSTSYKVQKNGIDKIKDYIDKQLLS